jgi:hypothetical protein
VRGYGGNTQRAEQLQRGAACVTHYQEQQEQLAAKFSNRYLALFDGEVLWDGPDVKTMMRHERESGRGWENAPQFMVRCVPPAEEIENLHWYHREAASLHAV